jgi:hypothetical protein
MSTPKAVLAAALLVVLTSSMWAQDEKQNTDLPSKVGSAANQPAQNGSIKNEEGTNGWLPLGEDPENRLVSPFLKHIAMDQKQFWTAPTHFTVKDLKWIAPLTGFTAALIASDSWISKQIPNKPGQLKTSLNVSDYATYSFIGLGAGSFLLGKMSHNDHLSETGLLSGEAAINAAGITYLLKEITQRPRPNVGNGDGVFFTGGNSFTSEHSALAWSIASVWAHEYPGTLSQILAYGLASTVTITRVTAQQHFSSDVFVGSALGWYFGRQVYRAHHDPELGGTSWGGLLPDEAGEKPRDPANMGSPYVPIDSWVYPLLERLAALGYIKTAYLGMRPWTRMECARMLQETGERLTDDGVQENGEAGKMYAALQTEFAPETARLDGAQNLGASLDSVYTRVTGISGKPLRDGYHFGQTIINDYGRPYGEGFNNVTGFTSHAVAGPFSISVQGEYQHAPAVASDPLSVLEAIAFRDNTLPLSNATSTVDRFRLLESSIGFKFSNVEFSFGKQSLWLGPGEAGPFLFSDNAEPIPMFRIDQVSPVEIPIVSRILGPVRTEFFLGRLGGQHWIFSDGTLYGPRIDNQPFIHGEKISFKPTSNFEFGLGVTALFGGPGLPFTWHNFLRTFYGNSIPGAGGDPGDRRSTFEFSYRVPYVRNYLTIYADSLVEDEISPLGSTRPSMRMGMYFVQVPKVPKLDLRIEGVYTDVPGQKASPGFIYFNSRYRSGYTNDGNLLASWIGRQGRGGQGWATYWLSSKSKIQLTYRRQTVDHIFLGGGQLNDFGANCEFTVRPTLTLAGAIQYEQWNFPVLQPNGHTDVVASVGFTYYPNRIRK